MERGVIPGKLLAELLKLARAFWQKINDGSSDELDAAAEKLDAAARKLGAVCGVYGIMAADLMYDLTDPDGLFADATNEELFNVFRAVGWTVTDEA